MRRVNRVLKRGRLILVLAAVVMGCASQGGQITLIPLTPMASQLPASQSDYIVQVGDTLNIKFYYHPDHDLRDLVVRPDGKLLLPLVGDMQAAGLTPEQLAENIAQRYSFTLREPKVAVDVKTANTGQVYVGGEVQRPGIIKRLLRHEDHADEAALAQDDLIFIPQTGIAKANIWVEQYIKNMMPFGTPR
jgi:protein involved in polysaccharide export with SLBB domain